MKKYLLFISIFTLISFGAMCQVEITGTVSFSGETLPGANVYLKNTSYQALTDDNGHYTLQGIPNGHYTVVVFSMGKKTLSKELDLPGSKTSLVLDFEMEDINGELEDITVTGKKENTNGIRRLRTVEGTAIFEAKKNEVIELGDLTANLATNNSRQVYAKVPGLNIYESDGAGLQLDIGARGLDPSRTANFNVRQNGYDISADALGYPESYYTPATEAVDRIEVVRGAASLQYGTQFGGLLNFVMKKGPKDRKAAVTLRNTIGSFGFLNTFTSLGGTSGNWNYYTFFQYKKGNGWRENSQFDAKMAYGSLEYEPNERFKLTFQYTFMDYLAQQPGGLTDALFAEDPRQSIRSRNWFQVNWNLIGNHIDYKFNNKLKLNIRNFALIGGRDALGNLGRIDRTDDMQERNLFVDDFSNFGSEARLIYNYKIGKQPQVALLGARYYRGLTDRKQGLGTDGSDADFNFLNPDKLENSDYTFPGNNFSLFAENVINLSENFSVTPGVRFEYIRTAGSGYYNKTILVKDKETGFAKDSTYQVPEDLDRRRSFIFAGLGLSYKVNDYHEVYANFSQNYRSINFNDIRVNNPNLVVDEDIQDERGYNFDLGIRGGKSMKFNYDLSFFYLRYQDRIGAILKTDPENYRIYRYRTNIADARSMGLEAFGETDILRWLAFDKRYKLNLFTNFSLINAKYINSEESPVEGNYVELVPPFSIRPGITLGIQDFKMTYQYSYVQEHYTDASNARFTPSAVEGIIPTYQVMDLSLSYRYKKAKLEASVNNLTDNAYFTRRATGYPGPGIIPASGRSFFLSLELNF
ncbi:TonB-dependent receptor [Echinicola jeungdonensis]|uniref:TonB-dependent receptor domain-containing protein n=1 Tax=Echinicola jeungdonensis TaxID=709343 RepID=A0ABV5J0F7_9BACT|nr:TonB-dependent receptor [Echinicola jeungdonensis]MDN3671087.1 TonB-dependent receptor [Echinicola jeungdonensis]